MDVSINIHFAESTSFLPYTVDWQRDLSTTNETRSIDFREDYVVDSLHHQSFEHKEASSNLQRPVAKSTPKKCQKRVC